MGTDDLFRKRKARKDKEIKRIYGQRDRKKRVLIVCEGEKTEPYYFRELLDDLMLPPQQVKVVPSDGSSPNQVLDCALRLQTEENISGDSYDDVYCVFDRDEHSTFEKALREIKAKSLKGITSTPCFEVWLLMHFEFSDAPFAKSGKKSVGDQVVAKLKAKSGFNQYKKGEKGFYSQLKEKLPAAIKNAKKLRTAQKNAASFPQRDANPWTNVDELVEALQDLSK
jgi:hypothetical protein